MTQSKMTEDPAMRAIEEAPLDEEPVTEEERNAIAEAKRRGRFITTAALRERLAEHAKR